MSLKIGVIGTGAIGQDHIRRCSKVLQNSEVVAVTDINKDSAMAVVKDLGINAKVYNDGHEVINAADVEAVLITSWGASHEEYVLAAIAAGKYVFCEKPLATTAEGCRRIVDAEIAHGKRLVQVGFMRPFDQGYRALKAVVDSGEIGEPLIVNCKHFNASVADAYTTDMAITDTLIHELDVLRWLLDDDYKSVQVIFPRRTRGALPHLRDPQIIFIQTVKGIAINVEVFVNCKYGYDIQCEVIGESASVMLPEPPQVSFRQNAKFSRAILTDWKDRFIDSYDVELQAFIDNVLADKFSDGASAWDGYAAAVAADACVKAQTTEVVELVSLPPRPAFYDK